MRTPLFVKDNAPPFTDFPPHSLLPNSGVCYDIEAQEEETNDK